MEYDEARDWTAVDNALDASVKQHRKGACKAKKRPHDFAQAERRAREVGSEDDFEDKMMLAVAVATTLGALALPLLLLREAQSRLARAAAKGPRRH